MRSVGEVVMRSRVRAVLAAYACILHLNKGISLMATGASAVLRGLVGSSLDCCFWYGSSRTG